MIEIEVFEHFVTMIRAGTSEVQLVGLDPEEFPASPAIVRRTMLHLSSGVLVQYDPSDAFAASTNETSAILTGILWNVQNDQLKFVATDRHRLASSEVPIRSCRYGDDASHRLSPARRLSSCSKFCLTITL